MVAGRGPVGDLRWRSSLRLRRHLPFTRSWVTTGHRQDLCPPLIAAGISLEFVSRYLCGRRRLLASRGRYFCHKRYFVPRKRFKWDESALPVCFVPIKRFIPHEIASPPWWLRGISVRCKICLQICKDSLQGQEIPKHINH